MSTDSRYNNKGGAGRTVFELILVAVILILLAALIFKPAFLFEDKSEVTLRLTTPESETVTQYKKGTGVSLPDGPEITGYTFMGWRDSQGNFETRDSFNIYENTSYAAVYSMAFDTENHTVLLKLEDGLFRPGDVLTNRECVNMLYAAMNTKLVGKGEFSDVPEGDSCYKAAATLKDLGILYGSKLHPDEGITNRELLDMLRGFYPSDYVETNLKELENDEPVTRTEAAKIMCNLLGRNGDSERDLNKVGTMLDVSLQDPDFWYIAESSIPHDYERSGDGEKWTESSALPEHDPGYFYIGTVLHLIDSEGSPVTDSTVDGFYFDKSGCYTCGNRELDGIIGDTLREVLKKDSLKYQNLEDLRTMYRYVVDNCSYRRRNYYDKGETGWAEDEAYTMITTHRGNCYNYAALFYEFARALGYPARIYSGTMGEENDQHAWVEIEIDGENRLFDPELEYSKGKQTFIDMFNRSDAYLGKYHYKKLENIEAIEEK